jgi:hypothetical protein
MLEKCGGNVIVWNSLPAFTDVKTKQDNSHHVINVIRQIIKMMVLAVFAGIQRFLSAAALGDRGFKIIFVVSHFGMVANINDVLPPFFSKVN